MISHILDLFHIITDLADSGPEAPECPSKPGLLHTNPHAVIEFLCKLDHHRQQTHRLHAMMKVMHLLKMAREHREEKQLWFQMVCGNNQELLLRELLRKKREDYLAYIQLHLWLFIYFQTVFNLAILLPFMPWFLTGQLTKVIPYQAPKNLYEQQRHQRTLELSFNRISHIIGHAAGRARNASLDYLEIVTVQYETHLMKVTMKDGTVVIHGQDANDQPIFDVQDPIESKLTVDQQTNRYADIKAALLYQSFLLTIADRYHADFWPPHCNPLPFSFERPLAPYHGMSQDQRFICRMLYILIHLGIPLTLNGEALTLQHITQEHWSRHLFCDDAVATTSVHAVQELGKHMEIHA